VLDGFWVLYDGVSRTGCRDEAQPVRQRRVVDESVGDHFDLRRWVEIL
jgi:hypothetical protein